MAETGKSTGRDRSPAYPIIPLGPALERLAEFEAHFKRSPARPEKAGDAWGIKAKAYTDRTVAALRYFGLLEYQTANGARSVVVSELGRNYLRAQQEETKRQIIAEVALKPKQIATFWALWGADRPADAACLDQLMLQNGFSDAGARDFLKVYDATISFSGLKSSDKIAPVDPADDELPEETEDDGSNVSEENQIDKPDRVAKKVKTMPGERELTTGLLSKDSNFRLIVSGPVGVKEIERLIAKLELDKEILAEPDDDLADPDSKSA